MPGTPTDVKFNIFKRINTGGLVLEPQEIRHALFQGRPATFIAELGKNKEFIMATGGKIKTHRMLDRDFANRFLAFYLYDYNSYAPDLDTFMSKAMASINDLTEPELQKITSDFSESMKLAHAIFKEEAFRKIHTNKNRLPPINKALFDAIAAQFALLSESQRSILKIKKTFFKRMLKQRLADDSEFFTSVSSSTGDRNRVIKRHGTIEEIIQQVINN